MPTVAIVGAGNFASVLALALQRAGYVIESIVGRDTPSSMRRARELAKKVGSRAQSIETAFPAAETVWFGVPDASISGVARSLANRRAWKGKIVLHSSGALTSDVLLPLRRQGAAVASVHPLMTFVKGSRASLAGVPFAIEGDAAGVRAARRIVRDLAGQAFSIGKRDKVAYHAWGTFLSPLLSALLATSERVAGAAHVPDKDARRRMLPIVAQTVANYIGMGAARGFSGPLVRGDVEVVQEHLRALRAVPEARAVYLALARAAVKYLPGKNRAAMRKALH